MSIAVKTNQMAGRKLYKYGVAAILFMSANPLMAKEPLEDYSFIRGVCHGVRSDPAIVERDMGFMNRLQLNSTRVWLSQRSYERDPEGYISTLVNYVRICNEHEVTVMPILFNGNGMNPALLSEEATEGCEKYVAAVVNALKDEEGLLMWDIMNEPNCNDYYQKATPEQKEERNKEIAGFLRHYIKYIKEIDSVNAITVGHWMARFCGNTADLVDVISFHDYRETRARTEESYTVAEQFSKEYGKPLINSEMGCPARSNPYDVAIEIADHHNVGWYAFNLVIEGYWGEIHGLIYPDGTIRDPAAVAAIAGLYRKRDLNTAIKVQTNREGHAQQAIKLLEQSLAGNNEIFSARAKPVDDILEAAEYCANLLEGAEMVPMWEPPSAKIATWRAMPQEEREAEREEIRAFAYDLALQLKDWCELF